MTGIGKAPRVLSNDFAVGVQEIADFRKRRWSIELFVRWIKQGWLVPHQCLPRVGPEPARLTHADASTLRRHPYNM